MYNDVSELQGKVLTEIIQDSKRDEIHFYTNFEHYKMFHEQDCCEEVYIEGVNGDWSDLLEEPILLAEEVTNSDPPAGIDGDESYTWTFYKLATIKGTVVIRWYGTSNGYYSESVDFCLMNGGDF